MSVRIGPSPAPPPAACVTSLTSGPPPMATAGRAEAGQPQVTGYDQVDALIKRGDALAASRRWNAARRAYGDAAAVLSEQGRLPAKALRRVANSYYFEERLLAAARVLDDLAAEAAAFGDPPIHARALADAAWLYARLGRRWPAKQRLARLEKLMTSPYLPANLRARLSDRVGATDVSEIP